MTSVLIVDAYTVLRHGLRLILQEDERLQVVGEAGTAAEVMEQACRLHPDVILMDVRLPDASGPDVIRQVRTVAPQSPVLVLTTSGRSEEVLSAFKAGAKGYLLKDISGETVVSAVHQVAAGQSVLPPELTDRLLTGLSSPTPTPHALTDRELEVLRYISRGLGNKEIAGELNISQNTVKTHVRRILHKLNLRSRTEATAYALQMGIISSL